MREIKFRLIKEDNLEPTKIVGYEQHRQAEYFYTLMIEYSEDNYMWSSNYIKHSDKEQFTGLKDRNGVEIYEGDIVQWEDWRDDEGNDNVIITETVEFNGGSFYPVCTMPEDDVEVIGNVHQNGDLLI